MQPCRLLHALCDRSECYIVEIARSTAVLTLISLCRKLLTCRITLIAADILILRQDGRRGNGIWAFF
jgi:hypothetical protein